MLLEETLTGLDEFNKDCSHARYEEALDMTRRNGDNLGSLKIEDLMDFFEKPDIFINSCFLHTNFKKEMPTTFCINYQKEDDDISRITITQYAHDLYLLISFYDSIEVRIDRYNFSGGAEEYQKYIEKLAKLGSRLISAGRCD